MKYRTLPHGGEKISVIGLGAGSLSGTKEEMVTVLNTAMENGINCPQKGILCCIERQTGA